MIMQAKVMKLQIQSLSLKANMDRFTKFLISLSTSEMVSSFEWSGLVRHPGREFKQLNTNSSCLVKFNIMRWKIVQNSFDLRPNG